MRRHVCARRRRSPFAIRNTCYARPMTPPAIRALTRGTLPAKTLAMIRIHTNRSLVAHIRLAAWIARVSAIAALAVGCVAPRPPVQGELRVSSEFTLEQQDAISEACAVWREATDGGVDLTPVVNDARSTSAVSIRPGALAHGAGVEWNGQMMIDRDAIAAVTAEAHADERAAFLTAVLHEIGHAATLQHASVGLMQAHAVGAEPACIDQYTIETACVHVDCGPRAYATCQ